MSEYYDGKLLVAPPMMRDWRFAKTVVYIWRHDVSGASGVILNRPIDSPSFKDVCEQGDIEIGEGISSQIFYGGPVNENMVGCLHSLDYHQPSTAVIEKQNMGFTLDKEVIKDIACGRGPEKYIITMGMAHWDSAQLESEIEAVPPRDQKESWLMMDFDPNIIWHGEHSQMWNACVNISVQEQSRNYVSKFVKD